MLNYIRILNYMRYYLSSQIIIDRARVMRDFESIHFYISFNNNKEYIVDTLDMQHLFFLWNNKKIIQYCQEILIKRIRDAKKKYEKEER